MKDSNEGKDIYPEYLKDQLAYLMARIDQLSSRVAALENGKVAIQQEISSPSATKQIAPPPEKVWDMIGRETLFSRIASICFLLVFALILRTITDNGIINTVTGTVIGLCYTLGLIAWGGWLFSRDNPLAPVFPVCGTLLLFTILIETNANFANFPTGYALLILFVVEVVLAFLGLRFKRVYLLYLATVGISLTAISLDFPNNRFWAVSLLLFTVNILSLYIQRRRHAKSLPWTVLTITFLYLLLWAFKLSVPLGRKEVPADFLSMQAFLPMLFAYFLLLLGSLIQRVRSDPAPLSFFHGMLPTINVSLCYLAAMTVAKPLFGSLKPLGVAAAFLGLAHFGFAAFLGCSKSRGAPGCNALAFAGAVCVSIALPHALGLPLALPILATLAFFLAVLSGKWQSGGTRFTSYLLQGMVCLSVLLSLPRQTGDPGPYALASFFLALMAFLQYVWCRRNKPAVQDSAYFAWLDRRDFGAVILLLSGMTGCFGLLRLGLHLFLTENMVGYGNAFSCGQTIIVNIGAMTLMYIASRRRNLEVLIISMVVTFFAAIRVFIFDLFTAKGLPLVISVFSFGLVALSGYLAMKNWQGKNAMSNLKTIQGKMASSS